MNSFMTKEEAKQQILELCKKLLATSENTDKYNSLEREIENLDHEIDETIYKLYGLTDIGIRVIESAI
jgi:transcription initiation factor IIE alpha subunit